MATLLATIGKEALQIYHLLPMTEEERKNPKEIIEKLETYFKPKRNIVYKRYMFFSRDQKANETFGFYLTSLRRLASSREFTQLEEELIRDRVVLGTTDGGVRARILRETSLTLDQAAMMRRNSEITQYLRKFKKQHNEEEEVSYNRRHRRNGYQTQRNQTDYSDWKRDNQGRRDFGRSETRKHLVDTVGERGNISPQKIAQHGEKDVEKVERRTTF